VRALLSGARRWQFFADSVALTLGINVWLSLLLLPGIFVNAWSSGAAIVAALVPLPILGLGIWRRSEVTLLLAFPSALLLPVAVAPQLTAVHLFGPVHFVVVAVGLVAYLFGASVLTSEQEVRPPKRVRPLSSAAQGMPSRWRRRVRVYRGLVALSVIFPAVFLYTVNFDDTMRTALLARYPGRVGPFTALLNLVIIGAWLVLFRYAFVGVLKHHRTGDRDLLGRIGRLRASLRRPRPVPSFYFSVVVALILMGLLLLWR
jgi:hypothetical protein